MLAAYQKKRLNSRQQKRYYLEKWINLIEELISVIEKQNCVSKIDIHYLYRIPLKIVLLKNVQKIEASKLDVDDISEIRREETFSFS